MINAYAESGDVDSALVGCLHWVWVGSLLLLAFSHKLEQLEISEEWCGFPTIADVM